jgi:glycosyltransferase involved in cell wall biosynthesis
VGSGSLLSVLLDATAVPVDRRGVGRYIDSLIPAVVDAGAELRVVARPEDAEHYHTLSGQQPLVAPALTSRRPARLLWEQLGLPFSALRSKPDVLHSPHYTHPLIMSVTGRLPLVVTLHDATFFTDPGVHTRSKGPFFRGATRLALRQADICVVPSQATAEELVSHAGARRDRLAVAHLGVDTALFRPPNEDAVRRVRGALGLAADEDFIAFLGTIEPRKNIPELIRGWVSAFRDRPNPPALVLAGGSGWDSSVSELIAGVPSGLRLLRPGYLPIEDLPALLGGSLVVAYPSLGEGFGLPVLEAMACGSAVLTSRRLALAEVGGDAVAYTDVDADSIAQALVALVNSPARRAELGRAGQLRAAEFSWQACADAHLKAYRRAVEAKR